MSCQPFSKLVLHNKYKKVFTGSSRCPFDQEHAAFRLGNEKPESRELSIANVKSDSCSLFKNVHPCEYLQNAFLQNYSTTPNFCPQGKKTDDNQRAKVTFKHKSKVVCLQKQVTPTCATCVTYPRFCRWSEGDCPTNKCFIQEEETHGFGFFVVCFNI